VSARVLDQLRDAGARDVVRLQGADPAATAVAVAQAMDLRSSEDRAAGKPAFGAAVIVDPSSADASAVAGLAAALRFPVLFTGRDAVPAVTSEAFASLKIGTTLVVGGPGTISDAVQGALPGPKRLGGSDAEATSRAVEAEAVARGLPRNIVLVADDDRPVDAALLGATVARLGGLLQLRPGGKASGDLPAGVDRLFVTATANSTDVPWLLIVASVLLAMLGVGLLVAGRRKRTRDASA
jgi:hypothetical protein